MIMCSIFNNGELETNTNNDENIVTEQINLCKCGSKDIVLTLSLHGSFCRECFLQRVSHKFRSEFGKSRLVRDNEDVAVAFSGGKKSTAMVNLITEGRSKRAQKKLRFNPTLIYLIEPKNWELSLDSKIIERLYSLEIPFYIFSLNQVFEDTLIPLLTDKDDFKNFDHDEFKTKIDFSKLSNFIQSLKEKTSEESMFNILRKQLLLRISKYVKLSKVLMGDTASQLAVRLVSFVSQGRGGQLAYEMEFADERDTEVAFVKPMRAFLDEEIDTLIQLKELQFITNPPKTSMFKTIEDLTGEFLKQLQTENDKTLSIICRTGEKLTVTKEKPNIVGENSCSLCKAIIDKSASRLTVNSAVQVSLSIADKLKVVEKDASKNVIANSFNDLHIGSGNCQNGSKANLNDESNCCKSDNCCQSSENSSQISKSDVLSFMCYGCQILVKNVNNVNTLPEYLLEEIKTNIRRRKMKEMIGDYILEDEDLNV